MRWLVIAALALAAPARAAERYAVIIGNNAGAGGDVELRYAHDDANKLFGVLTTLGGFAPENVTLLTERTADDVRRALITINDRLRTRGHGDDVLFVYYSGHATADELHLGRTALPLAQLESLVRGSAAAMRILVLDACRSGALTHVKGGEPAPPVAITLDERLAGEGVVVMTASAANEDAQESDELRGSFFTHYLVSALVGAGDADGDGAITIAEAYRSAYDSTLRASSRTLALQHPTFAYDVRGHGDFVITRLALGTRRALLALPAGFTYLVFRNDRDGAVVAEVGKFARTRTISVEPGRYFVRGRGTDHAVEGAVDAIAAQRTTVDNDRLHRVDYARLVHKGLGPPSIVAVRVGYAGRSPIADGETACQGGFAAIQKSYTTWSLEGRVTACTSALANANVVAAEREGSGEVRLGRPWDVGRITVEPAVIAGVAVVRQAFATAGIAPTRWVTAGHVGAATTVVVALPHGLHAIVDGVAETYVLERLADDRRSALGTAFVARWSVGVGRYF